MPDSLLLLVVVKDNRKLFLDMMFLTGKVGVENPNVEEVAQGGATEYSAFTDGEALQRDIAW